MPLEANKHTNRIWFACDWVNRMLGVDERLVSGSVWWSVDDLLGAEAVEAPGRQDVSFPIPLAQKRTHRYRPTLTVQIVTAKVTVATVRHPDGQGWARSDISRPALGAPPPGGGAERPSRDGHGVQILHPMAVPVTFEHSGQAD